jgi:hypothetical protein
VQKKNIAVEAELKVNFCYVKAVFDIFKKGVNFGSINFAEAEEIQVFGVTMLEVICGKRRASAEVKTFI